MKLPLVWLHDYCDPGLEPFALAERLTITGTKVEGVLSHGVTALEHFVVGKVLSAQRHPQADRLSVCVVDVGDSEPQQIVCGAPNVAAGQTVAVGRPGAVMPDGLTLGRRKLRGVESAGMILAEDEVAIGTDHDGIMVLPADLEAGRPLAEVLPIRTDVLDLEVTPNRPDCLAVYGLAREVHAATGAPLALPPWSGDPGTPGPVEGISVEVRDPDLCPRFTLRRFDDVKLGPSPAWLKARLSAAGQRPINNVVDVTNFVMLATGQPMHAFDADLVAGGRLVVRRGREGEALTTLDGVTRALDPDTCVIEDADGPTSLAGIMGGERSEVQATTTRVLMEAATWDGPNIQRTSSRVGVRTEASARFEKGLSPEAGMEGQALAAKLMVEVCGAALAPGTVDVGGPGPAPAVIGLRDARTARVLGAEVPRAQAAGILTRLGFGVGQAPDGLEVSVPHWRREDVHREADLIEEVARVWGLEKLPATLPEHRGPGRLTPEQRGRRRAEDALVGAGLYEIAGMSFAPADQFARLGIPAAEAVEVANPMSEEQARLRTTLLGSLLDAVRHNQARGMDDVRVWELAPTYRKRDGERLPDERARVAALMAGRLRAPSWREPEPPRADFFAAKGVLAALMAALRVPWEVRAAGEPFLHPGRAAAVLVGPEQVGWLGELHPTVAGRWDVAAAAGFELDLGAVLAAAATPAYEDLTSFPAVRQDLAVVVGPELTAARVLEVVRAAGGRLLRSAEVFDSYRGAQVGEGRASLALRLEFSARDRTLTDEEVDRRREKIVAALAREGASLRG